MTAEKVKILKSTVDRLGIDFPAAVEEHRVAMEKHRYTVDQPAPVADPWVMSCVRRIQYPITDGKPDDFVAEYEIFDDTPPPPPEPTLTERKATLIREVLLKEQSLLVTISPVGKRRLNMIRRADILNLGKAAKKPDKDFIKEDDYRNQQMGIIQRRAAEMMAEIEDLTEAGIKKWKMGKFE